MRAIVYNPMKERKRGQSSPKKTGVQYIKNKNGTIEKRKDQLINWGKEC